MCSTGTTDTDLATRRKDVDLALQTSVLGVKSTAEVPDNMIIKASG